MTLKQRIILFGIPAYWRSSRARRLAKKIAKNGSDGYSEQYKNDWSVRKAHKLRKLANFKVEVTGWENLPKGPAILAPNHSSAADPIIMLMALENPQPGSDYLNYTSVFLSKEELKEKKFVRGYMEVLNSFYINRKNPRQSLKEMQNMFHHAKEHKKKIIIFPGGTREKEGKVGEFKGGAFRFAKKEFLPIVPVTINNALSVTNPSRSKKITVEVIFGKPIKPMTFLNIDTKVIAARIQKEVQRNWKAPEGEREESGANNSRY